MHEGCHGCKYNMKMQDIRKHLNILGDAHSTLPNLKFKRVVNIHMISVTIIASIIASGLARFIDFTKAMHDSWLINRVNQYKISY